MIAIYKKELKTYFNSWIGYIFLFFFVLSTAFMFLINNANSGNPDYSATLASTSILFLILIPTLTMRAFSEEKKQKTDQLIFTSPISVTSIVLGKFLAALSLFLIALLITVIFPIIIAFTGVLTVSTTIASFVGYILLITCFISIGIFISALTENQIIAAVETFAILFFIYIIKGIVNVMPTDRVSSFIFLLLIFLTVAFILYENSKSILLAIIFLVICLIITGITYYLNALAFDSTIYKILMSFSLLDRFNNFNNGILDVSDIVYYITFSFAFIFLTINSIEKTKWK